MSVIAVIHLDEGSAYGVSFPDVPDCFAAADKPDDILKNAIAALDDYFSDGHPVPMPRGLNDIRNEVLEDLAERAYLISVPQITAQPKQSVSILVLIEGLFRLSTKQQSRRA